MVAGEHGSGQDSVSDPPFDCPGGGAVGERLVRDFRLADRVADFAREHHGTTTISHLLEAARARGLAMVRALVRAHHRRIEYTGQARPTSAAAA